jgi:4-amino-4-deoxy-L-arabinose transferase-like glycosyltransferase
MDRLKPFYLPLLFAIVLLVSFYRLGSVTLFDVDEAVFSQATKEMVQSGNWITPTYDGVNRYDKPILFYWLMAASYKAFGINELGARFPSAAAGLLLAVALFFFIGKVFGERAAFHGALAFTLSIYFFVYSHAAVTDMVLTLFITLSLFSFFLSSSEEEQLQKRRIYRHGFYLFSALAFLTKGLIGIVFPFGIVMVYLFAAEGRKGVKRVFDAGGIVLFVLVSAPWYAAEIAVNGKEFLMQFFVKHHFERYLDVISGHRGPVYYYVPVLIVGLLPWVAFLPAGIRKVFRNLRQVGRNSSAQQQQEGRLNLFAFIWFTLIILFFSCSTTKLPNYILSAVPAAIILIASGMTEQDARWRKISQGIAAVLSLAAGIAFTVSGRYLLKAGVTDTNWTIGAAVILFAVAALSFYALLKKPLHLYIEGLMLALLLLLSVTALPLASGYLQGSLHRFSMYARENLGGNERIIAYRANNPSIVFYSGHRVINVGRPEEIATLLREGKAKMVIAKTKDPGELEKLGLVLVDKGGGYALLEKK